MLLYKELKLALHPTSVMFVFFSAMLLIPNYPYYTAFFYMTLGIFFICLTGRENNDIMYTMLLPVKKANIVKARFSIVIILELLQIVIGIPFAIIRSNYPPEILQNQVGTNANISFFGLSLIMLALFNVVFFSSYYKNVKNVGKSFLKSSIIVFIYIVIMEALMHFPFEFIKSINSFTPNLYQFLVLGLGIIVYILATYLVYKKSQKNFDIQDI